MTTPNLTGSIVRGEGLRLKAYPDPLSPLGKAMAAPVAERPPGWETLSGKPWTCGYGCTGADVGPTTIWTVAQAVERRDRKVAEVIAELDARAPWWRSMCGARQDVLAEMSYNMGWPRLAGFKRALAAMKAHDYATAAVELLDSLWARQVGARATRLAEQMRTGEHVHRP